jgi:hypothetical protein
MATPDVTMRERTTGMGRYGETRFGRPRGDETRLSFKTTEFWAMLGVIAAILVATAVSDTLNDVRG